MNPKYTEERTDRVSASTDSGHNGNARIEPKIDDSLIRLKDLIGIKSKKKFLRKLKKKNISVKKLAKFIKYERDLEKLQTELVKMQASVRDKKKRVAVLFEGREGAGKGEAIRRFTEHLNLRAMRIVALGKPTQEEAGQWYFQRYIKELPKRGEIVFFDRSWYNRAVLEPVNGFCSEQQYERYIEQVPEFEHMLHEEGIELIKFWFSISKKEQAKRFRSDLKDPLRRRKLSPIDRTAQELWDQYTRYEEMMFGHTHSNYSPWIIVSAKNRKKASLETIRYLLSRIAYKGRKKASVSLIPDPNIIQPFHRSVVTLD